MQALDPQARAKDGRTALDLGWRHVPMAKLLCSTVACWENQQTHPESESSSSGDDEPEGQDEPEALDESEGVDGSDGETKKEEQGY